MNRTALALPLMLAPGFALADVTPEDVWANITATYSAMGLEVTSTPMRAGDTLTITDAMVTLTYPVIGGQATATLPQMGLIAQGDGSVRILMPDAYLISVSAEVPQEDAPVTFEIAIAQKGMTTIATGVPGDVTYESEAADYDMILNALNVPGEDIDVSMEFDSDGYTSTTRITESDVLTITTDMVNRDSRTSFVMDMLGSLEESDSTAGPMSTNTTIVLPPDMNIMNLTPALVAGLSMTGTVQTGATMGTSTSTMNDQIISTQQQSYQSSVSTFSIDQNGLAASGTATDLAVTATIAELLPFPIEVSMTGVDFGMSFPLVASDAPQNVSYGIGLSGLQFADGLWGMVDPSGGLNRSPIDLDVNLSGDILSDINVLDINGWAELENSAEIPVKPLSVNLDTLLLNALGGSVSGNGGFTFDNTDMATFPGMPRPEGSASIEASGLNAVIDQLVGIGIIPEDQAGMGRMMMGMFARSTGDDALESSVEINAEGHVIVNGQRMR